PGRRVRTMCWATALTRSASATEVPPYFWTTRLPTARTVPGPRLRPGDNWRGGAPRLPGRVEESQARSAAPEPGGAPQGRARRHAPAEAVAHRPHDRHLRHPPHRAVRRAAAAEQRRERAPPQPLPTPRPPPPT